MKPSKIILVFTALTAVLLLSACNLLGEVQDHTYKDYWALDDAGELEHGWAPDLLPESATDIHLKYDLDSNAILMAFEFDPVDEAAVTRDCTPGIKCCRRSCRPNGGPMIC